jgi:hypothetical protein
MVFSTENLKSHNIYPCILGIQIINLTSTRPCRREKTLNIIHLIPSQSNVYGTTAVSGHVLLTSLKES